jgi:hypothetical protein
MRIETTIQEIRPKDHSDQWKKRAKFDRNSKHIISVGSNAPVKHVRIFIEKYGITLDQIADVLGVA